VGKRTFYISRRNRGRVQFVRRVATLCPLGHTTVNGNQIVLQFENTDSDPLAESDLTHRYLWGPTVDQILADETLSPLPPGEGQGEGYDLSELGDVRWTLTDHLNTVRDLAVYNSGQTSVVTHRVFDAFGRKTSEIDPATGDPATILSLFGFTGKPFDEDTNLQNNINRWYEASTGKWLSEDPIQFKGDINFYEYVDNSPLVYLDPAGMMRRPDPWKGEYALVDCDVTTGKLSIMTGFLFEKVGPCMQNIILEHETVHMNDEYLVSLCQYVHEILYLRLLEGGWYSIDLNPWDPKGHAADIAYEEWVNRTEYEHSKRECEADIAEYNALERAIDDAMNNYCGHGDECLAEFLEWLPKLKQRMEDDCKNAKDDAIYGKLF
jgi:RHS repeat-associated protein